MSAAVTVYSVAGHNDSIYLSMYLFHIRCLLSLEGDHFGERHPFLNH